MTDDISVPLVWLEGLRLAQLVDEFQELVASGDEHDEAIARLAPTPYPEDADAAREFAEATTDTLLERRLADADIVSHALARFRAEGDLTEEEALSDHELTLPGSELDSWLRTLNAIRLVLASRLDIADEDDHDLDDPRYGVYDWLGYRLELLIQAAEEAD